VFEKRTHALEAFNRYNNVALDNKKMCIEVVEQAVPRGTFKTLSSGIKCACVAVCLRADARRARESLVCLRVACACACACAWWHAAAAQHPQPAAQWAMR
jgi:hypothetical protein